MRRIRGADEGEERRTGRWEQDKEGDKRKKGRAGLEGRRK